MRGLTVCILGIMLCFAAGMNLSTAQEPTPESIRVGVVVQSQGGKVNSYCLDLPPDSTGATALEATRLDLNVQRGPLGITVCRIQEVGCTTPAEACFCKCQGGDCQYWAYYFMDTANAKWKYSAINPAARRLKTGDIEGWLWNEPPTSSSASQNNLTPVGALPALTFDQICSSANTSVDTISVQIDQYRTLGNIIFTFTAVVISGILLWRRTRQRSYNSLD